MANSWNGPQLGSPIRTDVPELQKKLIALLKQDPTSVANIPSGAKRLVNTSGTQWQVQQYNGSSWAAIGKLMHDVDKLDGYHAAITPAASTVAVRNADKKLEGDITGNAATASTAATLSETLPVNKGGTGATTSEAARSNLGVPPTSHASSGTAYGLGSNLNYGHVRGDGETTDVIAGEIVVKDVLYDNRVSLTKSGLLGIVKYIGGSSKFNIDTEDFDILLLHVNNNTGTNPPGFNGWLLIRQYFFARTSDLSVCPRKQIAYGFYSNEIFTRHFRSGGGWYPWVKVVNETDISNVVRTDDDQIITGKKTFENTLNVRGEIPRISVIETDYDRLVAPSTNQACFIVECLDKNFVRVAGLYKRSYVSGITRAGIVSYQQGNNLSNFSYVYASIDKEGNMWAEAPTPPADSNTTHIATTKWVRDNASPVGSLAVSLATSMTNHLLCNGAEVSRTTYANLFALLGTAFGEGDGSTTFNLPDFRDKTFWGASGNLMSVIEAGLPDHNHSFTSSMGDKDYNGGGGNTWWGGNNYRTTVVTNASASNAIYGKSTTVQPPAIAVNIFIKY